MLYLISLGLRDERDISLKGLEAAKRCGEVYVELYTTRMETDVDKLSRLVGKKVAGLKRRDLEEKGGDILKRARMRDVGILVGGDALSATTHTALLLEARKMGIKYMVIHGSSIFSAVGETGLQVYKFGKAVTLGFPEKHYKTTGCYDGIVLNKESGLHTLVLLDVKSEEGRYMDAAEGLELLLEMEKAERKGLISPDSKAVAACRLGGNSIISYGKIRDLIKDRGLKGKTPAVLIIPGKLHFMEEEFLEGFG